MRKSLLILGSLAILFAPAIASATASGGVSGTGGFNDTGASGSTAGSTSDVNAEAKDPNAMGDGKHKHHAKKGPTPNPDLQGNLGGKPSADAGNGNPNGAYNSPNGTSAAH